MSADDSQAVECGQNIRNYAIDFIRFAFAVAIVYFHILHSSIMPYVKGVEQYQKLRDFSDCAATIVECFFILSGFFLSKTFHRHRDNSMCEFAWHKFVRLWPVLAFYFTLMVVFFNGRVYQAIYNVCFLQCIGLTADMRGITWYISPLFWATLFYFGLMKCISDTTRRNFIVGIIVYLGYLANMTAANGVFSRNTVYGMIPLSLARGLAGIGMGILISEWHTALSISRRKGIVQCVLCTAAEVVSLSLLCIDFFYKPLANKNQFIVVMAFSSLLLAVALGNGLLTRMLNRRGLGFCGRYSYSVYVMQSISFLLLTRIFWRPYGDFVSGHVLITLMASLVFSVVLGICTYYAIELPGKKILSRWRDLA